MKKITSYLLIGLFCLSLQVGAQTKKWTLEECVRHAVEHNIDLKQVELEVETNKIELHTSRRSWLPSLNASASQNFDFGRSPSKDGVIVDRNSANSSAGLYLSMPVFDGFNIVNTIASNKLNLQAATEALKKAREDLSVGVATYFVEVLYNKEILKIAELQTVLTNEQVGKTEMLVNAGKIPLSQLYDIKAQLAQEEVTLTEVGNNVRLSLLNLAQALELERLGADFDVSVPDLTDAIGEQAQRILPPDMIYDHAVAVKPQIKEQEYLLDSRRKQLKIAQSGYYPKLDFNANYNNGYYHYSGGEGIVNPNFSDQLNQNERKTLGLSLNIPIFNRFSVRNRVRLARVNIIRGELEMEKSRKTLYKEIQEAYFNATAAQEKYTAAGKSVEATHEAFVYAEERYAAGKSTVFEYNESKTKYAQSLSEQVQAKYDFIFKTKILDFYNGIPITL